MHRWWRLREASPVAEVRTDGGEEDAGEADGDSGRADESADRPAGDDARGEVEDHAGDQAGDDASDGTEDDAGDEADAEQSEGVDRANVEVTDAGEAEPADPKWEKPDVEDIPEFEIRADDPAAGGSTGSAPSGPTDQGNDPTAGRPNTARSPGQSRIRREGTEGYVAALELCARLPDDVRLPEEAADLVPAAVEAELEEDVQSFAAAEFDNPAPHVDELTFVEADGEVWLRLRLGVRPDALDDLDPEAVRSHALQELEGMF